MSDTTTPTRSEHSHAPQPPGSGTREDPTSVEELLAVELRPNDLAVKINDPEWFYVLRRAPAPAGEFLTAQEMTVAEWSGCDPDEDVLIVVSIDRAEEIPGHLGDFEGVREAVENGRLLERAVPASRLVVALREFGEARARGEWEGVREYVRPDDDGEREVSG